jgi:hypothetical protein
MREATTEILSWHRRQAMMLASQLPENATDANAVIQALRELVDSWLYIEAPPAPSKVLSIVRDPA